MDRQLGHRSEGRGRLLLLAALALCGAVLVAVVLAGKSTPSAEHSAQERCEREVLKRLASPSSVKLADVTVEKSSLDTDGRDQFPLTLDDPLKGVDIARITVLNVSGVVNAGTESGSTIQDHFDCRAYFVDGSLAHTLVVFNHAH
jgi:hypothetical protein